MLSLLTRLSVGFTLAAPLLVSAAAFAGEGEQEAVPVRITVVDDRKQPIPTASIVFEEAVDPLRVNSMTGSWEDSKVFRADASPSFFLPGQTLRFEVTARGFAPVTVAYEVRPKKNRIRVKLERAGLE